MTVSRRDFLVGLGVGAILLSVPRTGIGLLDATPASARGKPGPPDPAPGLDLLAATADTFRPHVGTRFTLKQPGKRNVDLTLAAVEARPPDGVTDAFSLLFRPGKPLTLPAATYELQHSALGTFNLFVVQVGSKDIEAVINHLLGG